MKKVGNTKQGLTHTSRWLVKLKMVKMRNGQCDKNKISEDFKAF